MSKVIIKETECYKCGFCMLFKFCDNNAIRRNHEDFDVMTRVYIDHDRCNGCLQCVEKANCNSFCIIDNCGKEREINRKFNLRRIDDTKPIIRKASDIEFQDGLISKYGKYIGAKDTPNVDFQFLEMKPHTEDAHVHDKETEIMLLWGGKFILWVKDKETGLVKTVESNGEQTCMMIPPGYAHGVKSIGDESVKIAIVYVPGIDNWP